MPVGDIIKAVGGVAGSLLGGSSEKKAAKQASAAETQAAQMNIDAAKEFRAENQANFQPWLSSGGQANSLIDSFLYGPGPTDYHTGAMPAPQQQAPQQAPVAAQTPVPSQPPAHQYGGFAGALQGLARRATGFNGLTQDLTVPQFGPHAPGNSLPGLNGGGNALMPPQGGGTVNTPAPTGGASPYSGFAAFINSPYYQFGQKEGMRALNGGYAAKGMLESGDAMKAITRYGQDYGYSQGLMPFLGLAGQQSDRGLQGAGAIAGVGLNALNTISNSNTTAGNASANAALAGGAANANMYAGIGSALGNLGGSLFGGSSYGKQPMFTPSNPGVGF